MTTLSEQSATCPYCGERITLLVDPSIDYQTYVEDCQVCCQPMVVQATIGDGGAARAEVHREDEG